MLNLLYGPFLTGRPAVGLLIFRLVTGAALILHGLPKMAHPFSWMPHSSLPGAIQALSPLAEVGGGLALILGLLTPVACLGIICNMLVAIFMVHVASGAHWIGKGNNFESALGYLVAAFMLLMTGPGQYALDAVVFRKRIQESRARAERKAAAAAGMR